MNDGVSMSTQQIIRDIVSVNDTLASLADILASFGADVATRHTTPTAPVRSETRTDRRLN